MSRELKWTNLIAWMSALFETIEFHSSWLELDYISYYWIGDIKSKPECKIEWTKQMINISATKNDIKF